MTLIFLKLFTAIDTECIGKSTCWDSYSKSPRMWLTADGGPAPDYDVRPTAIFDKR